MELCAQAPVYTNKVWQRSDADPSDIPHSATVTDGDMNVIVVGNTMNTAGNTDVLILKYDREGDLLWQETYAGSAAASDYGVCVIVDDEGSIYIAAAILQGQGDDYDVAILKYTSTGILDWDQIWDGPAGLHDIPAAMILGDDELFICGASWADPLTTDYMLVKYDTGGNFFWEASYDHDSMIDAATHLAFDQNGDILVTGASQADLAEWDYATLKYDRSTGDPMDTIRVSVPGVGMTRSLQCMLQKMALRTSLAIAR